MKPTELVPSLETCKKLKDFPETYFVYSHCYEANIIERKLKETAILSDKGHALIGITYPAPTVAELMEVLPESIKNDYGLKLFKREMNYVAMYYDVFFDDSFLSFASTNPAEALALLYIELKEKGVI